jgi:hypothetical protein
VGYREDLGLKFEFPDGFEERVLKYSFFTMFWLPSFWL